MSEYVTRNNEDIFSVINKTVGDLNDTYNFLLQNPEVTLYAVPSAKTVIFTEAVFQPPNVNSNSPAAVITSAIYVSRQGQTIYDICLMTLTDLNKLYSLNFNNTITPPASGTLFNFNPTQITDNILSRYVSENKIIFTTSTSLTVSGTGDFILREDGGYLLREDGGRFIRQDA